MLRCLFFFVILAFMLFRGAKLKSDRIVGGSACSIEDTPYLVSLSNFEWNKTTKSYQLDYYCGGSLLSEMWVLTAAHCFLKVDIEDPIYVTAGQTCQSDLRSPGIQRSEMKELFIHPRFNESTMTADLAVIKLKTPIEESKYVKFVKLSKNLKERWLLKNCNNSIVSGWGTLHAMDHNYKPIGKVKIDKDSCLQCLEMAVKPTLQCMRMNHEFTGVSPDRLPFRGGLKSVLCASIDEKDTCEGDSGGPLMCHGLQIGIVSLGVGCAFAPIAPIYTRVDFYYRYIQRVISSDG